MCQYYRWSCGSCHACNDVVVRCATAQRSAQQPCARDGEPLALPADAPPLECQQCCASHHAEPPRDHHHHGGGGGGGGGRCGLRPTTWRLPDPAGRLGEYVARRKEVLAASAARPDASPAAGRNRAWEEEAWARLQEEVQQV